MSTSPSQLTPDERVVLAYADEAWSWLDYNEPGEDIGTDAAFLILDAANAGDIDLRGEQGDAALAAAARLTERARP